MELVDLLLVPLEVVQILFLRSDVSWIVVEGSDVSWIVVERSWIGVFNLRPIQTTQFDDITYLFC